MTTYRNVSNYPSAFFETPALLPWGYDTSNVETTATIGQIADENDVSRWMWRDNNSRRVRLNVPTVARNSGEFLSGIYVDIRDSQVPAPYYLRYRFCQGDPLAAYRVATEGTKSTYHPEAPDLVTGYVMDDNDSEEIGIAKWVNPTNSADVRMLHAAPGLTDLWVELELMNASTKTSTNEATYPSPILYKVKYRHEFASRPTLTVTGPTGTLNNTLSPTVTWDTDAEDPVFHVRVFSAAQYGIGGFDPYTSPATWDSGVVGTWAEQGQIPPGILQNGVTYRAYVRVGRLWRRSGAPWDGGYPATTEAALAWDGGTIQWNTFERAQAWGALAADYTQFTVSITGAVAPTEVGPATGSTITTDRPILSTKLPMGHYAPIKAQWQLASDSGFTSNVRTVTEDDSELRLRPVGDIPFVSKEEVSALAELYQGTWYVRSRAVDWVGVAGSWSSTNSFTVSHPPTTGDHTPTGSVSVDANDNTVSFAWRFADPSPYDFQTAYQIIVERVSDSLEILNTGKIVSANPYGTFNINPTYKDTLLRWKVRVYDSDDVVGAYSATQQFYARDKPTVTTVYPNATALTVNSPAPIFKWTFAATNSRTQAAWRIIVRSSDGSEFLYDTGWQAGDDTQHEAPVLFENGDTFLLTLMVRDSSRLEGVANYVVTATWDPPPSVEFSVDSTPYNDQGYVQLAWTNSQQDGLFRSYRVYRRQQGQTWKLLYETSDLQATYSYNDYSAPAQTVLDYAVVQVAERYSEEVESNYEADTAAVAADNYWLISTSQPALSVPLYHVTSESFTEEYEEEEIRLIGRGRRREFGTRFGVTGSLTANVWGRELIQRIYEVKALRETLLLRNPFGDVWQVAAGNIQVDRIPGVGATEYANVTVPYSEVA